MAKRPKPVHQMTVAQFEATFPDEDSLQGIFGRPPMAEGRPLPALWLYGCHTLE